MVDGTIENIYTQTHTLVKLSLPVHDLCPITHEPLGGSNVIINYIAGRKFLRMRVLYDWIEELKKSPLDLETFVQKVGIEIQEQLMTNVLVRGEFHLSGGITLIIKYDSSEVDLL